MSRTYRAAYWISEDRQGSFVLTGPEHADLPDEALVAEATQELRRAGQPEEPGRIEIGDWTE